jgi:hypothetical protein
MTKAPRRESHDCLSEIPERAEVRAANRGSRQTALTKAK